MNEPEIILTDNPDSEARQLIDDKLGGYNAEHAGYWDPRPLAVLVRDPVSHRVVGGMLARTSLGLLFIDLVFLPESLRGQQIGTRMLRTAEEEAVRRGCRGAVLYTINFQAPGFYERHGWREFGRIPCDSPGTSRVRSHHADAAEGDWPVNNHAEPRSLASETAFLATLRRLAASNREPTPWETGCLYAALCALAVGDHRIAEQKIALSTLVDIDQPPPVQVFPPLTVDDLLDAFAALRNPPDAQ
jgi:GNAT superfamily N-acetyltransferase